MLECNDDVLCCLVGEVCVVALESDCFVKCVDVLGSVEKCV